MAMSPDKPARSVFELRLVGRAGQAGIHDLRAPPARAECRPVRTARSWRGIVSFTHLAREGRMTVTIKRRELLAALGGAAVAWPLVARAQQQSKMLRVGFVGIEPRESPLYTNFLKRMAELGYQEGRNFAFQYIQTPNIESYEKSYRDLAARKVDVFLAVGNEPALRAALSVADGKPIAFLAVDFDPLAKGYVTNLSRPGGNVTGIFVRQLELAAKRV